MWKLPPKENLVQRAQKRNTAAHTENTIQTLKLKRPKVPSQERKILNWNATETWMECRMDRREQTWEAILTILTLAKKLKGPGLRTEWYPTRTQWTKTGRLFVPQTWSMGMPGPLTTTERVIRIRWKSRATRKPSRTKMVVRLQLTACTWHNRSQ